MSTTTTTTARPANRSLPGTASPAPAATGAADSASVWVERPPSALQPLRDRPSERFSCGTVGSMNSTGSRPRLHRSGVDDRHGPPASTHQMRSVVQLEVRPARRRALATLGSLESNGLRVGQCWPDRAGAGHLVDSLWTGRPLANAPAVRRSLRNSTLRTECMNERSPLPARG